MSADLPISLSPNAAGFKKAVELLERVERQAINTVMYIDRVEGKMDKLSKSMNKYMQSPFPGTPERTARDLKKVNQNIDQTTNSMKKLQRQTRMTWTGFDTFGVRMSGVAASLFVFQQAIQWIRETGKIVTDAEDAMANLKMETSLTAEEYLLLDSAAQKAQKSGLMDYKGALEEMRQYIDLGADMKTTTAMLDQKMRQLADAYDGTYSQKLKSFTGRWKDFITQIGNLAKKIKELNDEARKADAVRPESQRRGLRMFPVERNASGDVVPAMDETAFNLNKERLRLHLDSGQAYQKGAKIAALQAEQELDKRYTKVLEAFDTELEVSLATMRFEGPAGYKAKKLRLDDKLQELKNAYIFFTGSIPEEFKKISDTLKNKLESAAQQAKDKFDANIDSSMLPDVFGSSFEKQLIDLAGARSTMVEQFLNHGKTKKEFEAWYQKQQADVHKQIDEAKERIEATYQADMLPDTIFKTEQAALIRLAMEKKEWFEKFKFLGKTKEQMQAWLQNYKAEITESLNDKMMDLQIDFETNMMAEGRQKTYQEAFNRLERSFRQTKKDLREIGKSEKEISALYLKLVNELKQNYGIGKNQFDGMKYAFKDLSKTWGTEFSQGKNFAISSINSIGDAIWKISETGKFDIKSLTQSILKDFGMMQYRIMMMQLFKSSGGGGGGGGGLGGIFGLFDFFGGLFGASSGGGMNTGAPAHIGAYGNTAFGMAEGGLITEPIIGQGLNSGRTYALGEQESELVTPVSKLKQAAPSGDNFNVSLHINAADPASGMQFVKRNAASISRALVDRIQRDHQFRRNLRTLMR